MKKTVAWLGALLLIGAQDPEMSVQEVKYRYEKELLAIEGVRDVSIGGTSGNLRLIIHVENDDAREAVRSRFGEGLHGYKFLFMVSRFGGTSTNDCRSCVCPCHRKTVAEPAKPVRREETCDMYRELMGLPKRTDIKNGVVCQQMVGWTNDENRIRLLQQQGIPTWKSQEMPGFVSYTYIKHRRSCPLGEQQVIRDIQRLTPTGSK